MYTPQLTSLQGTSAWTLLVFFQVQGTWPAIWCQRLLLKESPDGILIRPQGQWVFRRDALESVQFELFVTKFGKALKNSPVILGTASRFLQNLTRHLKNVNHHTEPELDVPPLRFPRMPLATDERGLASVTIDMPNPNNPRRIIDGQVYRISYNLPYHPPKKEYVIRILVWDSYHYQSPPNWKDHVHPIFQLYANLYPVMTCGFIDLGDFEQVVENRRLIKMAISLPREHPNHMPVSRDLSSGKRKMIIEWLSQTRPLYDNNNDNKLSGTLPYVSYSKSRNTEPNKAGEVRKVVPNSKVEGDSRKPTEGDRASKKPLFTSSGDRSSNVYSGFSSTALRRTSLSVPVSYYSLEQLRNDLQTALELEHATIPPYLTALVSIKEEHNGEVKRVLNTVLVQEMLHMTLVSNLLNAVGGKPSLTHKGFVLEYPNVLPGGVQRDLHIPLEKLSKDLIRNVFMKIEEPTLTVAALEERRLITEHVNKHSGYRRQQSRASNERRTMQKLSAHHADWELTPGPEKSDYHCLHDNLSGLYQGDAVFKRHKNTIGAFFNHILKTLAYLTKCGKDKSIFVGNAKSQLTADHWYARASCGHGKVIKVVDYSSAVAAIKEIVEEGEGSSPCMPAAGSPSISDLSHYFAFYSLYAGRVVSLRDGRGPEQPRNMSHKELLWWKVGFFHWLTRYHD